jgi:bifunctional non-homologous end joining protein LigD
VLTLPCKSAVIDGEVAACKEDGTPDFRALHFGNCTQEILCVGAFDLMELNGHDLRPFPLVARKQKLDTILRRHDHVYVRHSEPFKNGEQLLAQCRQRGLEGIVSKRKHSPYKSGKCDWGEGEVRSGRKTIKIAVIFLRAEQMVGLDIAADEPHEAQSCGS